MSTTTKEAPKTKVITQKVRFSYFNGWEAVAFEEGDDKKYSTRLLILKTDTVTLADMNAAIEVCVQQAKAKNGGKLPAKFKMPLRDGDEEFPDDPSHVGCYFLNATSKSKPGIVDKNVNPIINQDEVYSGCYGRASVNFFYFDGKGKGVAGGLNNIQKLEDGPTLTGRSNAAEDFGGDFGGGGADLNDIL